MLRLAGVSSEAKGTLLEGETTSATVIDSAVVVMQMVRAAKVLMVC